MNLSVNFGWFSTVMRLADDDITKITQITDTTATLVFNFITIRMKEQELENMKNIMKQK